jgi:Leucine-rich repeat (LRR) protein
MSGQRKLFFMAMGVVLLAGLVLFFLYHGNRNNPEPMGTSEPVGYQSVSGPPIDSGIPVTSTRMAEVDPSAVFRLNLSNQAPTPSSTITTTPAVPLNYYISSTIFSSLTNLTLLNLANDNIASITPDIGGLTNLQVLYLAGNQLTSLPDTIGNLKNLWLLSLFNNQITSLPSTVAQLKDLKVLALTGNPIVDSSTAMAALRVELPNTQIIVK